jgi:hypothetical protein
MKLNPFGAMIMSWEWKDNFLADLDLSKEEAAFYKASQKNPVCYMDCIYKDTDGCRVHSLGVSGITECIKFEEPDHE